MTLQQHDEVIWSWLALFLLLHVHKLADTTQLPSLLLGVVPSAQKQSGLIPGRRVGGWDGVRRQQTFTG